MTGSYGAGHDSAAAEIARRLTSAGWLVDPLDIADLYPFGFGHFLRRIYFATLRIAPRAWAGLLDVLDPQGRDAAKAGRRTRSLTGRLPARRLAASIRPDTDLVISTHPFASQSLGVLRRRGVLQVPAITYLTDASVHPLWVSPDVDGHVAVHEEAARQARRLGARDVQVISPLTPTVPAADGNERTTLRRALGLPASATIALISSGSEGVGDVVAAARDIRATGAATPVVLCGRNAKLQRQLDSEPGIVALGWVEGLTDVLRGSDCLIQNSGGFTTLEALTLGVPLISYRCIPGHGAASAEALLHEGLAPWPQSVAELADALTQRSFNAAVVDQWEARPSLLEALPGRSTRHQHLAGRLDQWKPGALYGAPLRRMTPRLAGQSSLPHIALTLDDGPDLRSTPAILETLSRHGVRATFFLIGEHIQSHRSLIEVMHASGHELAVHGWTHRCTLRIPPAQLQREITATADAIADITGTMPRWYRPPYGVHTKASMGAAQALELEPVHWTAWGRDWSHRSTPQSIDRHLTKTLLPGGTVLLHDTDRYASSGSWQRTNAALQHLLPRWRDAGLKVGPLNEHW